MKNTLYRPGGFGMNEPPRSTAAKAAGEVTMTFVSPATHSRSTPAVPAASAYLVYSLCSWWLDCACAGRACQRAERRRGSTALLHLL